MKIKLSRYSVRALIPALLTLMSILSLSGCGNNLSPQSISSSDSVKTATSKNLDRFLFLRNGKLGYIDRTGQIVIPAKFDRGLAIVLIPTKCKEAGNKDCDRLGYIDKIGKLVFEF